MPTLNRSEDVPHPQSIDFFVNAISRHGRVVGVEQIEEQIFLIKRHLLSDVLAYYTNVYIIGVVDVVELLDLNNGLNSIVTASGWNSYTQDAKEYALNANVGLFKMKEFMGALHYDGRRFIHYYPPDKDERDRKKNARRL